MDVFGGWGPLLKALGSLAFLVLFGQRAVVLWKDRKRRKMLARRKPPRRDDDDGVDPR